MIRYWDKAWSLIEGCTPVSPACENCWLASLEFRFGKTIMDIGIHHTALTNIQGKFNGQIRIREERLNIPLKTRKPTVFAIWSDLFHPSVPYKFINEALQIMMETPRHTFLILTKRTERMAEIMQHEHFAPRNHIYLGTTIENQEMADWRIPELIRLFQFNLFISIEPLLENIHLPYWHKAYIKCAIVGCESGKNARETKQEWIDNLRSQCKKSGTIFWLKQWRENGKLKKATDDNCLPWRNKEL